MKLQYKRSCKQSGASYGSLSNGGELQYCIQPKRGYGEWVGPTEGPLNISHHCRLIEIKRCAFCRTDGRKPCCRPMESLVLITM